MTSNEIATTTGLANNIGRSSGVHCRYEWTRIRERFQWNFYRKNVLIGWTSKQSEVVLKMQKFIEVS